MNKLKKALSVFLSVVTIISFSSITTVQAQADKMLKNIIGYYDWINDDNYDFDSFTLKQKSKIRFTYNSEIISDVSVTTFDFDSYYDDIFVLYETDVTYFSKTVTLDKGTYDIEFSADIDWDDENKYNYSLLIEDVTVQSTGIKFKTNKKTCSVGSKFTLKPTYSPSGSMPESVTYSSSNTKVATVSKSGVVTAKNLGKCTITAKLNNGKKAKYTVIVNSKELYVFKGLSRTAPLINGKTKAKWKSSKSSIASVSSQNFKGVNQGATKYTTKVAKETYTCHIYVVDYDTLYKKGVALYKDDLLDPYSFKVYHTYRGYDKDGNPCIVLDSGAKNLYNAMVRDYCNIWVEYNSKSKKFKYHYYNTDYKPSLSSQKKLK